MHTSALFGFLAAAATAVLAVPQPDHRPNPHKAAVKCPLIFDGRIKSRTPVTDFDSASTSLFNPDNVKSSNLKWSQIIKFPEGEKWSRFDNRRHKPLEVTISDESVFKTQYGFRRAGLIFAGDTNTGSPASKGVKTLHFSVRQDSKRPLNLTHEYLNIWHETSDWSANQFNFQTGTINGQEGKLPKNTTLQVYYSKGNEPLRNVTKAVSNNNAGEGQYQFGILKKPTGTDDVVNKGYQESWIDEGQIYGGIFIEDSAGGSISL
ncbi:hypothetical protein QBC32DRAFT_367268 [Pseudoneurospora amorphoporcata]|uniref:Glycoside hydrolase 131 catalytic N-terminal domain-containing protein n=1 Tax=Pseudoneurospora amorphoporcata TaxID=241081 RepID=A0AAN6P1M6_9PEZI|nr:hypothetical protein QBC32DRAFT_367268 [Pseudoneurospora amorphoporcata]